VRSRYSTVAILLHWLIAAALVFQIVLAWRMDGRTPQGYALMQLHKSVGITILLLSLARLGWRVANPPPPMVGVTRWERLLANATHAGFYVIMIGMPLTGWMIVSTSKIVIPTLLYGVIPWPHLPVLHDLAGPARVAWNSVSEDVHHLLGFGFYLLIALHVAGALKHQFFDREEIVLGRMAPGAKPGRWLEPRLAVILASFLLVVAAGVAAQPQMPKSTLAPVAAEAPEPEPEIPATPPAAAPAAAAEATTAAVPTAVAAEPVQWTVAPGSTLGFSTEWGGVAIDGRFERWTADILFSPDALDRSKVRVEIDIASASTGDAQRDEMLPSPDWLDAAANPKAVFTATRFERTGTDRYVAHGGLTLRGVTKPVRLPFQLKIEGDKARVSGVTSLDRTAFGVGQGEWKSTDQIPANVKVKVSLTARRR
jgi:polyisoprenoid-binding protein YceI/cytochrome b561